jgi:hypothetical protein
VSQAGGVVCALKTGAPLAHPFYWVILDSAVSRRLFFLCSSDTAFEIDKKTQSPYYFKSFSLYLSLLRLSEKDAFSQSNKAAWSPCQIKVLNRDEKENTDRVRHQTRGD